jgi:hypothetical protein
MPCGVPSGTSVSAWAQAFRSPSVINYEAVAPENVVPLVARAPIQHVSRLDRRGEGCSGGKHLGAISQLGWNGHAALPGVEVTGCVRLWPIAACPCITIRVQRADQDAVRIRRFPAEIRVLPAPPPGNTPAPRRRCWGDRRRRSCPTRSPVLPIVSGAPDATGSWDRRAHRARYHLSPARKST